MAQGRTHSHSQTPESPLENILSHLRLGKIRGHLKGNMIVCDMGCGYHGYALRKMHRRVKRGIGIDRFVSMEPPAPNCSLVEGDLNGKIPLPDGSVDAVTSLALLEHLGDPGAHLKEVYRILRPGGILLLTTPTPAAKPVLEFLAFRIGVISATEIRDHKVYYGKPALEEVLRGAGFRSQKMKHSYFQFGLNQRMVAEK